MSSPPDQPGPLEPSKGTLPYDQKHLANVAAALREDRHPTQIGPYTVLQLIGEGGMGSVYKARQSEPIDRVVAIKVIKFGMDSRAVLSRFDSERKALALMDHPNVARVLDAGTTVTGRPYFVMEYVDGEPITTYADRLRLPVRERLRLLVQACSALQHAHQKAIIHRDLKPSNILVTAHDGQPLVKVIDFGVAKAIEQTAVAQTLFTEAGQLVGTPEYMSPEQADGNRDIDTRSDVYSLGVVLFELLSGALPFDSGTLRAAGYGEVCRIIREVDPPRPSAKLSSLGADAPVVADRRQLAVTALVQQLRLELDWVVIKSLRKERDARYASAAALAEDIENYLANRPLRAGPESVIYRTRKFVRRNKAGVVGAMTAACLLLGGTAATGWQAVRATRAERATRLEQERTLAEKQKALDAQAEAERERKAAEQVSAFLTTMLESIDPDYAQGREPSVRDLLDKASSDLGSKFTDQPRIAAALHSTIGQTYASLGVLDKADLHLQASYDLYRSVVGDDDPLATEAFRRIAMLRNMQDRLPEAYEMNVQLLERSRRLFGPLHDQTRNAIVDLGVVSELVGKVKEAEALFREALAADERVGATATEGYFITIGNLGQMLRQIGRLEEAEQLCRQAFEGMRQLKGPANPTVFKMQGVYADVLRYQKRYDEAERNMREYLDLALKVYGPDHLDSINPEQGLAVVLAESGKRDEATPHFRSALERARRVLGDKHRETLWMMMSFAASQANAGEKEEANALFKECWQGWMNSAGLEHPTTVITLYGYVQTCYPLKRWEEALEPARLLYEAVREPGRVQITPGRRARYLSAYGIVLAHLHRFDDAREPLTVAFEALIAEDISGRGNLEAYHSVVSLLEGIARQQGRVEEADRWLKEWGRYGPPPERPGTLEWPTTQASQNMSTTAPSTQPAGE